MPTAAETSEAPCVVAWNPQPDITPFELAQCLPIVMRQPIAWEAVLADYPEEVRRHFTKTEHKWELL